MLGHLNWFFSCSLFITIVIARTDLMQIWSDQYREGQKTKYSFHEGIILCIKEVVLKEIFVPRVHWHYLETFLVVTTGNMGRGASEIQQIGIRNTVKHPTIHRTAPCKKSHSPKCQLYLCEKFHYNESYDCPSKFLASLITMAHTSLSKLYMQLHIICR